MLGGFGLQGTTRDDAKRSQSNAENNSFGIFRLMQRRPSLKSGNAAFESAEGAFCRYSTLVLSIFEGFKAGCPTWIRTMTKGSKDLCATITPSDNAPLNVVGGSPGAKNFLTL